MTGARPPATLKDPTTAEEAHPLVEAGQHATETAGHLAERATDLGFQQADRGREQAAEGIDRVAESIRRISTDMQAEQPTLANAALTVADQAQRVAQYLRQTDARAIISNVEDAARRQPLIFLGGAFVLGVAVSRFIKAAGSGAPSAQRPRAGEQFIYGSAGTPPYRSGAGRYEPTGPGTTIGDEGV